MKNINRGLENKIIELQQKLDEKVNIRMFYFVLFCYFSPSSSLCFIHLKIMLLSLFQLLL